MILLIDADSMVYSCSWGVDSAEEAFVKFDNLLSSIFFDIQQCGYSVQEGIIYHGNKGNFRYDIDKTYKANRTSDKPEFYKELSDYVKTWKNHVSATGEEVDDLIAKEWQGYKDGGHEVCIVSIDKDYLQLPALIYNYSTRKRGFTNVSMEDATRNFWTQMITGDAADNVNYLKGKGPSYAKKLLEDATGAFSHFRRVYLEFVKEYGTEAKTEFNKCYRLLKLG